ncbi:hypothetical protein HFN87_35935 [Rhizobium laguerreae]|uniref:hypothetical protein n=1 Tax=Rhizobium laguerreae TaxID=1076926 RepID=UPI001C90DAD4|nr:hypothetical protein [Rhizobium laguerreae]MBY3418606.1 hypothetical protein [Rhizobium laguerreae]
MSNAWQRYYAIRKLAYEAAEITLSEVYGLPVQLTEIDDDALEAFEEHWLHHPYRRYDWEWRDVVESWENRPSHFEVAIWCNAYLSGLAVGKVSDGKLVLSIYLLEGSPVETHPLKGLVRFCVVEAAEAYATILGCDELHLRQPVDGALPLYFDMGFFLATNQANVVVCSKELKR